MSIRRDRRGSGTLDALSRPINAICHLLHIAVVCANERTCGQLHPDELHEQREQHLLRVIELDPDHVLARRALGSSEIGGQWVKKEEYLARQGYTRYKGKWRLPQEIDLAERRQSEELAKNDWYVKLSRWRSQLNDEKRHAALSNIRQVRDPLAIEAIGRLLHVERDQRMVV